MKCGDRFYCRQHARIVDNFRQQAASGYWAYLSLKVILGLLLLFPAAARAQGRSVTISWTASTSAPADPSLAYNVYRSTTCTGLMAKIASVGATTYTDKNLVPGQYAYEVTSVWNGKESGPSNCPSVTVTQSKCSALYVNIPFSCQLTATAGILTAQPNTYRWRETGVLPAGLNLTSAGFLSGTPTNNLASRVTFIASSGDSRASITVTLQAVALASHSWLWKLFHRGE